MANLNKFAGVLLSEYNQIIGLAPSAIDQLIGELVRVAPTIDGAASEVLSSGGTSITESSYTPSTGTNRMVVAVLSLNPTSATAPSGLACAFGAVSMTKLAELNNGTSCSVAIFYCMEDDWPSTPANVVATWTTTSGAVLNTFTVLNCHQTWPFDAFIGMNNNTGTSTTPTVTVNGKTNATVMDAVAMVAYAADNFVVGSGQTSIGSAHCNVSSGEVRGACSYEAGSDASIVMDWTNDTSFAWVTIGVCINGTVITAPDGWIDFEYLSGANTFAGSGSAKTETVTITDYTDAVMCLIGAYRASGVSMGAVTYNGTAMTLVHSRVSGVFGVYLYRILKADLPAAGTYSISVTPGATAHYGGFWGYALSGVYQDVVDDTGDGYSSSSQSSWSNAVDVAQLYSIIMDVNVGYDRTFTPDTGQIEEKDFKDGSSAGVCGGIEWIPSIGTEYMGWTPSSATAYAQAMVSMRPHTPILAEVLDKPMFEYTLTTNADGQDGYTHVQIFGLASLSIRVEDIQRIRVRFRSGGGTLQITNAYVGHQAASGDPYDFDTTPVQLLFSSSASVDIPAGSTATSDWAEFAYSKDVPLIIAFYTGGGTFKDSVKYATSVPSVNKYLKLANDAATVNKTGYSLSAGNLTAIDRIELWLGDF